MSGPDPPDGRDAATFASAATGTDATEVELARIEARLRATQRSALHVKGFRRAAVLVPVLPRPEGLQLLFTVRSADLSRHAGQISFPGGGLDSGEDAVDAALRETWEEVGVRLDRSAILGMLDDLPSPAGYVATPVVAVMEPGAALRPNPAEVADVFVAPVAELLEITPSWEERRVEGVRRRIHFYPWNGRLIWGFTGNVLEDFLARAYRSGSAARDRAIRDGGTSW